MSSTLTDERANGALSSMRLSDSKIAKVEKVLIGNGAKSAKTVR